MKIGPLSVALDARMLQFYGKGVFNPFLCSKTTLDHGRSSAQTFLWLKVQQIVCLHLTFLPLRTNSKCLLLFWVWNNVLFWRLKWPSLWLKSSYFKFVEWKSCCIVVTSDAKGWNIMLRGWRFPFPIFLWGLLQVLYCTFGPVWY